MELKNRIASLALAFTAIGVPAATAQSTMVDVMIRHGVPINHGAIDVAFDAHAAPAIPVSPGSFATPIAGLTAATGREQIAAAYAFGILAGWSGRAASPQELMSAGQSLVGMIRSTDRASRIAGARVAGRIFAAPYDRSGARPVLPAGMVDALFVMLNEDREVEQLAAMDALGLLREPSAVSSLTERYFFYRDGAKRALAGGALEAMARIGDPSAIDIVKLLAGDKWADGKDATALAVAFARERLLRDGSIAVIQQAANDNARRNQARGYLAELGAPVP